MFDSMPCEADEELICAEAFRQAGAILLAFRVMPHVGSVRWLCTDMTSWSPSFDEDLDEEEEPQAERQTEFRNCGADYAQDRDGCGRSAQSSRRCQILDEGIAVGP